MSLRSRTTFRLLLALLLAPVAMSIAWAQNQSQTIYYTKNVSIGVVYIATAVDYDEADYIEVTSGSIPPGVTWASFGTCAGIKLCTAYYGTPTALASGTYVQVLTAHHLGSTFTITATFEPNFAANGTAGSTAVIGLAYSASFTVSGGTDPATWSLYSGSLPPGVTLNASTGGLSGTPITAGTYNFVLRVTDSTTPTALTANTASQTINVYNALSVTTSSLPATTVGATYSQTLASSGGTTPKTWSVSSGALPAGLSLNASTGAITGTPTTAGTANFNAQVACCSGATGAGALSILVNPPPGITTSSLPDGSQGGAYSQSLAATGGTGSLTWTVSAGSLPTGLSMSSAGVISGTASASGAFNFTARAVDTVSVAATQALSIQILNGPSITTTTLADVTVGQTVSTAVAATSGTPPYTWSVPAGALPAGISLNASSGALTGTPSTAGTASFTVQVTDANTQSATQALSWLVHAAPSITTSSLAATTVGASYSSTLASTGGKTPLAWSVASGSLPAGLSLNATTGAITGTPSGAGTASFTARVTDANGVAGNQALSIQVNAAPSITTSSLPQGITGAAYSQTLAATGGTGSLTWSVTAGSLPAGLALSGAGALTGTPTTVGTYNFTVQAQDTLSVAGTQALSVNVVNTLSITTTSLADVTVGQTVSTSVAATGGTAPYTWTLSAGALPAGITMNSSTGALTGTPSSAGTAGFTVQVTDANTQSDTQVLSWTVNAAPSITTSSLAATTAGAVYSATLAATGGAAPLAWSVASGALPAGLSLNASTGAITGTASSSGTAGFTARVSDANSVTGDAALSITVNPAPSVTTSTLPQGVVSAAYSQSISATGGTGSLTYSISEGALPPGLSLSAAGALTGTPTTTGNYKFGVQARDTLSITGFGSFALAVIDTPSITTSSLAALTVGQTVSASVAATGGTAPYTWSIASGSLPSGLSLNASSGALTGTPATEGVASFTLRVTDANSQSDTQVLSWTVNAAPSITTTSIPETTAGRPLTATTLAATGGAGSLTWSATGLPAGTTLSAAGVMSGTPSAAATTSVTFRVTDANGVESTKALSVKANATPSITTTTLARAMRTAAYSRTLASTAGTGSHTWSIASGALPPGLALSAAGTISGTPTSAGAFPFTAQVTDQAGASTTQPLSLESVETLTVTTASLPDLTADMSASAVLESAGGTAPLTWSILAGALPAGITLNTATGTLAGTPSAVGLSAFTMQVRDADGFQAQRALTWQVNAGPLVTALALPEATAGRPMPPTSLAVSGGSSPFTWTAAGLPAGITLSAAGELGGSPAAAGATAFIATATDRNNARASREFKLTVNAGLAITTPSLPYGTRGRPYSLKLARTGGTPPFAWSSANAMPDGLTLNAAEGVISGTPTATGGYPLELRVVDTHGSSAQAQLSLGIIDPIRITTSGDGWRPATAGVAVSHPLSAAEGIAPYTWSLSGGSPPPGVTLDAASGLLSGSPSAAGTYSFAARVTDNDGGTDSRGFTITVNPAPRFYSNGTWPPYEIGAAISRDLIVTGGTAPLTWSLAGGSLPPGVSLQPTTGSLSGTASAAGAWSFTVKVEDANLAQDTASFELRVQGGLAWQTPAVLPSGAVRSAYAVTFSATGGVPPYQWRLDGGALPPGLTFDSTAGALTGTPRTAGDYAFDLSVLDQSGQAAARQFLLHVDPAPGYRITPETLAFSAEEGGPATAPQTLAITSTPPNRALTVASSAAWLTASLASAETPVVTGIVAHPGGLAPGEYTAEITVDGLETLTIPVTFTVSPATPLALFTEPAQLAFPVLAGAPAKTRMLQVNATGPLQTVTAQVDAGAAGWLSVSPPAIEAGSGQSAQLAVSVDPAALAAGAYRGVIQLQYGGLTLPVEVEVTADAQHDFELSFSGLTFRQSAGTSSAPQQVTLLNHASTPLNWMATSESWLRVDPPAGTTVNASTLFIAADTLSLPPGAYAGRVTVAPQAGGLERTIDVRFEVTSGPAAPQVQPAGLLFRTSTGEAPAPLPVTLHNPSDAALTFVSSRTPLVETGWLAYGPASGSVPAGGSLDVLVNVSPGTLPVGPHRVSLTFEFSDGTVRVVDVVLVVSAPACEATRLIPMFTRTLQNFRGRVGQPEPIEVMLTDDCGVAVESAAGLLRFSSPSEPAMNLTALGGGLYSATWVPRSGLSSVTITATLDDSARRLSGSVQVTGSVAELPVQ